MIVGEKASPSRWMVKRFTATAVERMLAETEFTSAALSGAVLRRMKNSASRIAAYIIVPCTVMAITTSGIETAMPTAETR